MRKAKKVPIRVVGSSAGILTGQVPDTSQKRYHFRDFNFGSVSFSVKRILKETLKELFIQKYTDVKILNFYLKFFST
jgi:hypothetical protein